MVMLSFGEKGTCGDPGVQKVYSSISRAAVRLFSGVSRVGTEALSLRGFVNGFCAMLFS